MFPAADGSCLRGYSWVLLQQGDIGENFRTFLAQQVNLLQGITDPKRLYLQTMCRNEVAPTYILEAFQKAHHIGLAMHRGQDNEPFTIVATLLAMDHTYEHPHASYLNNTYRSHRYASQKEAYVITNSELYVDVFCGYYCYAECYHQFLKDFMNFAMRTMRIQGVRAFATSKALPK